MQAAPAAHAQQVGCGGQQVGERLVGDAAQLLEAQAVAQLGLGDEALVAGQVAGFDAGDLGAHRGRIAAVVEVGTVVETDAVERVERLQRHVLAHAPAAQGPQLFEHEGRGDDGGAGVEGVAVLAVHARPAAEGVELLQHRDAPALARQPHGRGEAAEAAADWDYENVGGQFEVAVG